jgi:hypothetical protein
MSIETFVLNFNFLKVRYQPEEQTESMLEVTLVDLA